VIKPCARCGSTERYKNGRCRRCSLEYQRAWHKANPGKRRQYMRTFRKAHPERIRQETRRYREANREKVRRARRDWYEANRERAAEYTRRWCANNLDRRRQHYNRYRARKNGAAGSYTAEEWKALLDHYEHRCLCCGRSDVPMTVDHIVPLCQGGSNEISNLQPLCLSCNTSKGTKYIDYRPDAGPERWLQGMLL
jgi:5-methylcytosine-specific restriction endonuclease McrA